MQQKQSTSIVWFTDNLRARDNFVLGAAMKASRRVIGVYFLTPERFNETQFGFKKTEKFRAKFLLQTLNDLKSELDTLNISLLVFNTAVEKQMRELVKIYDVNAVYQQKEWKTMFGASTLPFYLKTLKFLFTIVGVKKYFIH